MQSEKLESLAKALAKAQSEMGAAIKNSTNPHFKSRYADLSAVFEACREALTKNGFAIVQRVANDGEGACVETMLLHSSGEWVSDRCWLPVGQKTAQAYGSAITYARRYGLASLAGIATEEDDDGNAASTPSHAQYRPTPPAPVSAPAPAAEPHPAHAAATLVPFGKNKGKPISELTEQSLAWYRNAALEELADPSKEKFRPRTEAWLAAIEAELAKR